MDATRTCLINGKKIEQIYWNGRHVVYIDNKLSEMGFDEAVTVNRLEAEKRHFEESEDTTSFAV